MWSEGCRLGFIEANVDQRRSAHDLLRDFEDEVPMCVHAEKVVAIVPRQELTVLSAWLRDLAGVCVARIG